MNNSQLAIFLEKYMMVLGKAIAEVEEKLPPEMVVASKNILGQAVETIPAFSPLYEVLNLLDDDIELLKKNLDNENT